ncbi:MAG: hypothetical protein JWR52_980 [Marmoricola sp.]|nr:hypothetical protein [Marmoricola sp.]
MKKAVPALAALLLLLTATACGGGSLSSDEKPVADKISTALAKPADSILTKSQATCVADAFVSKLGLTKLKSAKVVTAKGAYNTNGANVDKATSAAYTHALLGCLDEAKAKKAVLANVTKAFTASSAGVLEPTSVMCFSKKFVDTLGVPGLMASQIVTDAGEFNTQGSILDAHTSGAYADAFLGCVNYQQLQAEAVAKSNPKIDAVKLEACLTTAMPTAYVRALIVANQTQSPDAATLNNESNAKAAACAKQATAVTKKK